MKIVAENSDFAKDEITGAILNTNEEALRLRRSARDQALLGVGVPDRLAKVERQILELVEMIHEIKECRCGNAN